MTTQQPLSDIQSIEDLLESMVRQGLRLLTPSREQPGKPLCFLNTQSQLPESLRVFLSSTNMAGLSVWSINYDEVFNLLRVNTNDDLVTGRFLDVSKRSMEGLSEEELFNFLDVIQLTPEIGDGQSSNKKAAKDLLSLLNSILQSMKPNSGVMYGFEQRTKNSPADMSLFEH